MNIYNNYSNIKRKQRQYQNVEKNFTNLIILYKAFSNYKMKISVQYHLKHTYKQFVLNSVIKDVKI